MGEMGDNLPAVDLGVSAAAAADKTTSAGSRRQLRGTCYGSVLSCDSQFWFPWYFRDECTFGE